MIPIAMPNHEHVIQVKQDPKQPVISECYTHLITVVMLFPDCHMLELAAFSDSKSLHSLA